MDEEKRLSNEPIPDNVADYLNKEQLSELHKIEGFGWGIKYIRHPLFQKSVIVVTSANGSSIGILEEDGRLNLEPNLKSREE